jgi:hypothetical protein
MRMSNDIYRQIQEVSYLVVTPDFTHEFPERLVDVDAVLGGGLDELAVEVLGEITSLCVESQPHDERYTEMHTPFMPT